ncbi:hypothetical protein PQ455_13560 [Sphingomonas naphthae]|uniref:Uncharacterized protein n=1 Tax=Sphingomonas naphthae TaxID=1813468 RepID=A0ABY7TLC0_9SPHN|nr:hypothetical protein [Sphingomonas naphthae]WCT72654.1 hypothetical protein PQ455_13560 [Sphingomonas naphthae]
MERDQAYYYERAEAELRLAQQATEPAVVKAHYQLAGYYLDRVYGGGDHSRLSIEECVDGPVDEELRERADRLASRLRAAGVIIVRSPADR